MERHNYTFLEPPDREYTIDIAPIPGRKEVTVELEVTRDNVLDITVKTNFVDDYEIQYSEFSVDVSTQPPAT